MRLVPHLSIWAVLAVAWFGTLGLRPLYKADETRYAEIPREMVASGVSQRKVAAEIGVSQAQISKYVRFKDRVLR